jgi:hypothetical protein
MISVVLMNKKIIAYCLLLTIFIASCTSYRQSNYTFNKKYSAVELREDFSLLKKILEANHPSLYWYLPKDSVDYYFNNGINSITDSLTETQFRNKVAYVISKIKCGHTSVLFSKDFNEQFNKHRYPSFPLHIKTWGDSMVVLANLNPRDSIFKRGTIITSINHKTNKELLDSMFQFISSDGYAYNFKSQAVSGNFPVWYKNIFGLDSVYSIQYINAEGKEASTFIKNYFPVIDTTKKKDTSINKIISPFIKPSRKQIREAGLLRKRSMNIDTSLNTAFIHLATFNEGKLRKFFRRSFKTIHQQQIKNVVVDLRENGGGDVTKSILLTKYLIDTSFKIGDTVAAINRNFPYKKYIRPWWLYWFPMHFAARKESDGRIHEHRYETHYFNPKTNNHFNGNIYLIQGGYTFSAATMFAAALKGQHNVTLTGEESGGGYYGNSAMHLLNIVLPNSKTRVVLPMYRLVMDKNREKGRGIIPDVYIPPSSAAIKKGIDIKIETVIKLIQQKNTN